MNPDAAIFIVMGKTDPDAERHRQQSMILVPRDTPGVTDRASADRLRLRRPRSRRARRDRVRRRAGARVELDRRRRRGLRDRAGATRTGPHPSLHARAGHGRARAVARARARAAARRVRPLARRAGRLREWVAESRIQLEALRLLVLKTAWLMDTVGNRAAMTEIQAIKIAVPRAVQQILDRAIQVFGAAGLSGRPAARRDVRRRPGAAPGGRPRRGAPERAGQGRVRPLIRLRAPSGCRHPRR